MKSRTTRLGLAVTAIAALAAAGLTACVRDTEITVDGLPVTNAASHIRQVDGLWRSHLTDQEVTPTTSDDSSCFFLMYDNVALNSIVCGPVFWLGDLSPTWDYYPLETVLSPDGRSLQAVARRSFMRDYPMSEADDLFRPDNASPNLAANLAEPAAPVTTEPVLHMDGLPEERRITADLTFDSPVYFHTGSVSIPDDETPVGTAGPPGDGGTEGEAEGEEVDRTEGDVVEPEIDAECTTVRRVIWSTHVGEGAGVIAAPDGHQFVTLVTTPGCPVDDLLVVDGAEPLPEAEGEAEAVIVVDGAEVPAPGWEERGSYVVPAEESPTEAALTASLFGTEVYVDLLTGSTDPVTESLTGETLESPVPEVTGDAAGTVERWEVTATATGRPFQNPGSGVEAVLTPFLPQFGAPPTGEKWLVVGLTLAFGIRDAENPAPTPGAIQVSADLENSGRMVRVLEMPESADSRLRHVTAIVSVPKTTTAARLTMTGTLTGWMGGAPGSPEQVPDTSGSVTVDLAFPAE